MHLFYLKKNINIRCFVLLNSKWMFLFRSYMAHRIDLFMYCVHQSNYVLELTSCVRACDRQKNKEHPKIREKWSKWWWTRWGYTKNDNRPIVARWNTALLTIHIAWHRRLWLMIYDLYNYCVFMVCFSFKMHQKLFSVMSFTHLFSLFRCRFDDFDSVYWTMIVWTPLP